MRTGPFLVSALLLLALGGCVPTGTHVSDSPSASATPVFASDAEALAAAEKAYAAYLKVSDQIANDGGKDPDRFSKVVTKEWLPSETESAAQLESSGRHQIGSTTFSSFKLEQVDRGETGVNLVAYTCLSLSGTRILDVDGRDVTPPNRSPRLSVEVSFQSTLKAPKHLLVDSNEPWSGPSFC